MTETKNLKLKTYETTTDGQELVARYIDNTSDNFQKIDEFCKTDTTLSVEGGIADAKTVGDNVNQLKEDLTDLNTVIYGEKDTRVHLESGGFNSNGVHYPENSVLRFVEPIMMEPGDTLTCDGTYQWMWIRYNLDGTFKDGRTDGYTTGSYTADEKALYKFEFRNRENTSLDLRNKIDEVVGLITLKFVNPGELGVLKDIDDLEKYNVVQDAKIASVEETASHAVKTVFSDKQTEVNVDGKITAGIKYPDGTTTSSTSTGYTENIPVSPGMVVTCYGYYINSKGERVKSDKRFRTVTAYSNGIPVASKGTSTVTSSFNVKEGTDEVSLSIVGFNNTYNHNVIVLSVPNGEATYYNVRPIKQSGLTWNGNIVNGSFVTLPENNVKLKSVWTFSGLVSSMGTLSIGNARNDVSGYINIRPYIEVTSTEIILHSAVGTDTTVAHGVTIGRDLRVRIETDDTLYLKHVIIESGSQHFDWVENHKSLRWGELTKYPSVSSSGCVINNCSFGVSLSDIYNPVWVFGDSWTSIYDTRWVYYAIQNGHDSVMFSGYAGGSTMSGLLALRELIKMETPKVIVWCYGMNDEDTNNTTPNASWLECLEEVKTICENNSIELILATIPTTKTRNMNAKNKVVRESGYRYVDQVAAMGADESGNWIPGYVSDDGNHTSVEGAKALYMRFCADVPELNNN